MSKKIILLINSMTDGGAEKVVLTLLDQLHQEGCQIELVCLEKTNKYVINSGINVYYLSDYKSVKNGLLNFLRLPILAYKLYKLVKTNNIAIVQSHLFRANYVNVLSKVLYKSQHEIQVVNHSIISRYKNNGLLGFINLQLIKYLYPFTNKILSVSKVVQEDMQRIFNLHNEKIVIYNMFNIKEIQEMSAEIVENFEFKKNKKYLISVGRLIELKRNRDAIITLSRLENNVELIFIGEGKEKENLKKLVHRLQLESRVHFIGWVPNPYKYISKADILINTSESESFGNVIVESMACETLVISTKCGGPEEIIEDKKDGVLVEIGDIDALVDSIKLLLKKSSIKDSYILEASKNIKLFDIDNIIKEYKKVLKIE